MDMAELFVTATGLILIVAILWFFFGPRQAPVTGRSPGRGGPNGRQ